MGGNDFSFSPEETREVTDMSNTRAKKLDRFQRRVESLRSYLIQIKEATPCHDCCLKYPYYVMDFDHRDDEEKTYLVSRLPDMGRMDVLLAEIEKCDIICSNCHRERTNERKALKPYVTRGKTQRRWAEPEKAFVRQHPRRNYR